MDADHEYDTDDTNKTSPNETRAVKKEMADFSAIRSHSESNDLPYFTFYLKSQKPIKAVTWHLQASPPAGDSSDVLVNPAFHVISVKQMSTTRLLKRAPHINNSLAAIEIWSWAPDGSLTPRQADGLTVYRNITLTFTEVVVRRIGLCEVATSLRGHEPKSRGTSTTGRCYQAVQ
jgi:hypothetical protein